MSKKDKRPLRAPIDGKTVALGFALGNAFLPGTAHGYYAMYWGLVSTTVGGTLWLTSTTTKNIDMDMSTSYLTSENSTSYLTSEMSDATTNPPKKPPPPRPPPPPPKPTGPSGDDPTDEEPFIIAKALVHSALLQSQGDLGMHMRLLSESPTAFAQLAHELSLGEGPAVDALVTATELDVSVLQTEWTLTASVEGEVDSGEKAQRFAAVFLRNIAPQIKVRLATRSELAWRLIREQKRQDVEGKASGTLAAHTWLARWMGVSTEALMSATGSAVEGLQDESDLRAAVYANPQKFFGRLARSLSTAERDALGARAEALKALREKLAKARAERKSDA
jgi:hypothetical protein